VTFDEDGKISQIRQSWDQGALLKQLDVIGKTGRNWPIRTGDDQLKLITTSIKGAAGESEDSGSALARSRGSSTHILRDPHASLNLFAPREEVETIPEAVVSPYSGSKPRQRTFTEILGEEQSEVLPQAVVSPYSGSRPRQRSFTEILGDRDDIPEDAASEVRERSQSPSKAVAPKIGAGKNFQPSRLFDRDDGVESGPDTPEKADRFYRPHPHKYQHFEMVDGSDPKDAVKRGLDHDDVPKSKHDSNWSFNDFVTPQKPNAAAMKRFSRLQDARHWGNEEEDVAETPVKIPAQPKPRRDAEAHFELRDDGPPSEEHRQAGRLRGAAVNTGLGLYKNNLYNEDGSAPSPVPDNRALGNITNLKDRRKDFDSHWDITDESPHLGAGATAQQPVPESAKVSEDRMKAVKMMESSWAGYDESPAAQKENNHPSGNKPGDDRGIVTVGDGMGGKKGSGRGWAIGGEEEDQSLRPVPNKKPGANKASSFWDF
jgi:hypothetical protein